MALAFLADAWARARGGSLLALTVDHGLRPESAREAATTVDRLRALGIEARVLTVADLPQGSGIAERARAARYRILRAACAAQGILHLLLGHHAADQAETVMIRVLGGSGGRGLAGMAMVAERTSSRLIRPLLTVPPAALRRFLTARDVAWVEDPSNSDDRATRARVRRLRGDASGEGEGTRVLLQAIRSAGCRRATGDRAIALVLAKQVVIRPEGFAILTPGALPPEALAQLLRCLAGAPFAPGMDRVADLAARMRPATIWGVRIVRAKIGGDGWLLVREAAKLAPPMAACDGVMWDGRFRLHSGRDSLDGATFGALGDAAGGLRRHSNLPAAVLRTMPALWRGNVVAAVPHLRYPDAAACEGLRVVFAPPSPLSGAPFLSSLPAFCLGEAREGDADGHATPYVAQQAR
jgi:tRNA(Ile)-lysidine synthase